MSGLQWAHEYRDRNSDWQQIVYSDELICAITVTAFVLGTIFPTALSNVTEIRCSRKIIIRLSFVYSISFNLIIPSQCCNLHKYKCIYISLKFSLDILTSIFDNLN